MTPSLQLAAIALSLTQRGDHETSTALREIIERVRADERESCMMRKSLDEIYEDAREQDERSRPVVTSAVIIELAAFRHSAIQRVITRGVRS